MPTRQSLKLSIANAASVSDGKAIGTRSPLAIAMPAAWTAAVLTFEASADGGTTWGNVVDETGAEISVTVAAGTYVLLDAAKFAGIGMFRVRSGPSGGPVNQAADRDLILVTGQVL